MTLFNEETDSPSSQYRNRYIFDVICRHYELYGTHTSWHYPESGHGKGPCDGLDGAAKRLASEAVRQGKTNIQDAQDFFNWAKGAEKNIKYLFYSQDEYDAAEEVLNGRIVRPVPGTMKAHAVIPDGPTSVYIREVSCCCETCLRGDRCDGWEKHDIVPKTTNSSNTAVYKIDKYVVAVYQGKRYVGKVVGHDENDGEVQVTFMEAQTTKAGLTFKWPHPEDVLWMSPDAIVNKIKPLTPIGRSKRAFVMSKDDESLIVV